MYNKIDDRPLVSVVIPAYNCGRYVCRAIDSVYAQNWLVEVLLIDDCSAEDLESVINNYKDLPGFRYLKNPHNLGVAGTRNRGVREAAGKYVAFLDADDWWADNKLDKQFNKMMEKHTVLCSTGRELMNADGSSTGKIIPVREEIDYHYMLYHNSINCSSVLVEREVILEFPMEHDDSHEDYITWLKILNKYGKAAAVNEPLLKYRLSEGGKSRNKIKSAQMTFRVYRYMGYGKVKSFIYFVSYAFHGVLKYL